MKRTGFKRYKFSISNYSSSEPLNFCKGTLYLKRWKKNINYRKVFQYGTADSSHIDKKTQFSWPTNSDLLKYEFVITFIENVHWNSTIEIMTEDSIREKTSLTSILIMNSSLKSCMHIQPIKSLYSAC